MPTNPFIARSLPYGFLANAVLSLHALVVLFVIGGLLLVVLGNLRSWRWVNAFWFRLLHLATIFIVVVEAWLGLVCPLTTLEMWLRAQAGVTAYSGGFIEHWLQSVLFWEAPSWVFTTAYSSFGLAVAATWWYFPPKPKRRRREASA
ncbi:MAG: putative rane protein [Herbaspirillum sp.]|jgi:hypothetical protein|nr:putative rane protein [Herbaspirillum sp.]